MFIDVHQHLYAKPGVPLTEEQMEKYYYRYFPPEEVFQRYASVGIDKAIIMPNIIPESTRFGTSISNEQVLELHQMYPDKVIPYCNVDPRLYFNSPRAPLGKVLEFYKMRGCRGVGEVTANLPFNSPLVQNLFAACQDLEMPLTFHISPTMSGAYGLYDDPGLPLLEETLRKFPRLTFFGHSQPFWAEIGPLETPASRNDYPKGPITQEGVLPKLMRRYPNLHGDLSAHSGANAITRDREYGCRFLEEFQDRLLFGTDIYAINQPTSLMLFLQAERGKGISEECFQKVAKLNALRIFALTD